MVTPLPILDALTAASKGGFYFNHGLITITAIGCAESKLDACGMVLNATARNTTNTNGTTDRGWLQINSVHTDITDTDCDDPVKAAAYAFNKLSAGGTIFTAWSTYNNGAYKNYLKQAYLAFAAWKSEQEALAAKAAVVSLDQKIAAALAALNA